MKLHKGVWVCHCFSLLPRFTELNRTYEAAFYFIAPQIAQVAQLIWILLTGQLWQTV